VTQAKNIVPEKSRKPTDKGATQAAERPAGQGAAVPGTRPAQVGRRHAGAKEVIPFKWKLVGESYGAILTLFKSVEREESEAQLQRVQRDGYYTELRILDIDEEIKQPPSARLVMRTGDRGRRKISSRAPKAKKTGSIKKTVRTAKSAAKTEAAPKSVAASRTSRTAKAKTAKTAKMTKAKKAARTKRKRTVSPRSTKRRTAKAK
jgi:hypothetical protein